MSGKATSAAAVQQQGGKQGTSLKTGSFTSLELTILISLAIAVFCIAVIIVLLAQRFVRRRARANDLRQQHALDDAEDGRKSAASSPRPKSSASNDARFPPWQDLPNCWVPESCGTLQRQQQNKHSGKLVQSCILSPSKSSRHGAGSVKGAESTTPVSGLRVDLTAFDSSESVFGAVTPMPVLSTASDSGHGSVATSPVSETDQHVSNTLSTPAHGKHHSHAHAAHHHDTNASLTHVPTIVYAQPNGRQRQQSSPYHSSPSISPLSPENRKRAQSTSAAVRHHQDAELNELLANVCSAGPSTERTSPHETSQVSQSQSQSQSPHVAPPIVTVHTWPRKPEDEPVYSYDRLAAEVTAEKAAGHQRVVHACRREADVDEVTHPVSERRRDERWKQQVDV